MAGKTRRQSNENVDAVTARVTALEAFKPKSARAYWGATQSATNASFVALAPNTMDYNDIGAELSLSGNWRLTATKNCELIISVSVAGTATMACELDVFINGGRIHGFAVAETARTYTQGSTTVRLLAGQYLEIFILNSSATTTIQANSLWAWINVTQFKALT